MRFLKPKVKLTVLFWILPKVVLSLVLDWNKIVLVKRWHIYNPILLRSRLRLCGQSFDDVNGPFMCCHRTCTDSKWPILSTTLYFLNPLNPYVNVVIRHGKRNVCVVLFLFYTKAKRYSLNQGINWHSIKFFLFRSISYCIS